MIRLNVFVRVNESNREETIKAAKELTACSLKEEGCIAYDTFESSTRPDVFMICETWQNAEVLAAHEKSPHFAQYVGIIQKLAEMKLDLMRLFENSLIKSAIPLSFRVELVEFLMDKYSFNPISCVIRFKFQQDIAGISGTTGKMIDKPILPKFLLHLFVSYNFHFPR